MFAHSILQILRSLQQKTERNRTSTLIFLTINIYPQAKSQAPDSVHWQHEIALEMEGLGVNKLKDNKLLTLPAPLSLKAKFLKYVFVEICPFLNSCYTCTLTYPQTDCV